MYVASILRGTDVVLPREARGTGRAAECDDDVAYRYGAITLCLYSDWK